MAVLKNLTEFQGSIGNMSAYKRCDSDKTFLRTKGGASKDKIKKHKNFQRTRELNTEWSGCAKAGALIRNLLVMQQLVADFNTSAALVAIVKNIQVRDSEHEHGKRSVLFSRHAHLLDGFQLNRKNTFESVIRANVDVQFMRSAAKAIIHLPELVPAISFIQPVNLPAFRICISMGTLPDMHCFPSGYDVSDKGFDEHHFQQGNNFETPWYYTGTHVPAQTIELAMQHTAAIQPHDAFMVAISVNFGTPITNELVKTNKHTGAGKILKVHLNWDREG